MVNDIDLVTMVEFWTDVQTMAILIRDGLVTTDGDGYKLTEDGLKALLK